MTAAAGIDPVLETILASLMANRLVLFFGAGMSVGHGSAVPSAADLASACASKYEAEFGGSLGPALHGSLEQLAVHFLQSNQLEHIFTQKLVPWGRFRNPQNEGHEAIADFLLCKAVYAAISTNVDMLCERGAEYLGETDFRSSWDGIEMNTQHKHAGYLKLHGCFDRDRHNLLWCKEQLVEPNYDVLVNRLATSKTWLSGHLLNKDLLFMGFWTDWSYLNEIFAQAVDTVQPPSVIVVDILGLPDLQAKAPDLFKWVNGGGFPFHHLPMDCVTFITQLRERFSRHFMEHALESAKPAYQAHVGAPFTGSVSMPAGVGNSDLYQLRRDLTGVPVSEPVRMDKAALHLTSTSVVHLQLRARGYTAVGAGYANAAGQYVRVVNGSSRPFSRARDALNADAGFELQSDFVIVANTLADATASNIVRPHKSRGIIGRSSGAQWLSASDAQAKGLL